MPATPSAIEDQTFPFVKRGFDPEAVKAYLSEVAEAYEAMEQHARADRMRLNALERRVSDRLDAEQEVGATLIAASDTKARIIAAAENRARELIAAAERRAAGIAPLPDAPTPGTNADLGIRVKEAEEEAAGLVRRAAETKRLAVREAEETVAAARAEALEVFETARAQAEEILTEAAAEREHIVGRLRSLREALRISLGQGRLLESEIDNLVGGAAPVAAPVPMQREVLVIE